MKRTRTRTRTEARSGARPQTRRDNAKRSGVVAARSDQTTRLPDVRDGLTPLERTVLTTLKELQTEKGGRRVSAMELYGRVVEKVDLSQRELQSVLLRLAGR